MHITHTRMSTLTTHFYSACEHFRETRSDDLENHEVTMVVSLLTR
jgi:hypothetical protein